MVTTIERPKTQDLDSPGMRKPPKVSKPVLPYWQQQIAAIMGERQLSQAWSL